MLSKFFYCKNSIDISDGILSEERIVEGYASEFPKYTIRRVNPGGTLGIFYKTNEEPYRFIKTYTHSDYSNLEKEYCISKYLYGESLHPELINITGTELYVTDYIDMDSVLLDVNEVLCVLQKVRHELDAAPYLREKVNYSVDDVYAAAKYSYDWFKKNSRWNDETAVYVTEAFERWQEYLSYNRVINHGDLSNVNIVKQSDGIILIDWEDALMAFEKYDVLYWLTFFQQRKYYSSNLFKEIGVDEIFGKDVMILILLVKEWIAAVKGTSKNNLLSAEERIREIIEM